MSFQLKYISDDKTDKWVEIGCPILILCILVALYIPPLFQTTSLKLYLSSHNTLMILLSVIPSQLLFLIGPLAVAFFTSRSVRLREKLALVNWKISYLLEAFKLEMLLIIPLIATAALSYFVSMKMGYDFSSSPIIELLSKANKSGIALIFIFSAIVAPIVEEIAFRRVIFTFMARIFGSNPSIILTSFIFACMHGGIIQFLPLFILALALQYLYIKNNSLYPAILLHCIHNSIIMLLFILGKISSVS